MVHCIRKQFYTLLKVLIGRTAALVVSCCIMDRSHCKGKPSFTLQVTLERHTRAQPFRITWAESVCMLVVRRRLSRDPTH